MTRFLGFEIPFAPDSRYPTLFVGSRVTKLPLYEPHLGGNEHRHGGVSRDDDVRLRNVAGTIC